MALQMLNLFVLFFGTSFVLPAIAQRALPDETEPIRRHRRQTSFADGLTSGSILNNLWKRDAQFDSQKRRFRRQFTSFADGSASGTILNNLWKREAMKMPSQSGNDLLGGRAKRFSSSADGFTSGTILSNLWKRETVAENVPKAGLNELRAKRQWSGADSLTSGSILNNLWKRQALFEAEIPTFTK